VRIGIVLPVEGEGASKQSIVKVAREAERLKADSVWASDRILMPAMPPGGYPSLGPTWQKRYGVAFDPNRLWLEPLTVLSLVAGVTERIRLGTNVLVLPYRQPLVLAQELASLDRLSGGRLLLGVGAGWMVEEFDALQIPRAQRGRRTDEYIHVLRCLWSSGGPVTFNGEFVSFTGVSLPASPARVGGPPVLVGGNAQASLARVARLGDGWLGLDLDPRAARRAINAIQDLCAEAGRSTEQMVFSMRRSIEPDRPPGSDGLPYGVSPQQLAQEVGDFIAAGVNLMVFDLLMLPDMLEGLHWLFSEVLAQLGGSQGSA
jgi:probable F420-dependent oxidoreductase